MGNYNPFIYRNITVVRAVDGDTVEIIVDTGFKSRYQDNFRLTGIDTPERGQDGFHEATNRLLALLIANAGDLEIETVKRDKYGRWLAEIRIASTGHSINQQMVTEGHAKPYDGGKR